jgi:hypothetical protein
MISSMNKITRPRSTSRATPNTASHRAVDFNHPLFPACDGEPWRSSRTSDPQEKLKREFLEAYFRINLAYARLVELRKKRRSTTPLPAERSRLIEIEKALVAREKLEDRHASRGLIATPVYHHGLTVNVRFADARTARSKAGATVTSSASVRISIPLPPGLRAKLCKN